MPTVPNHEPRNVNDPRNLSLNIYAAMLGDRPAFDRETPTEQPRLKMRVRLEARVEHANASPFYRTTLRDHVERVAAYAARALDDARERLAASRPKAIATLKGTSDEMPPKPIVLVGPAARRHKAAAAKSSRAA